MNKVLNLIGLAKKAGRAELGEEPVAAAVRARSARVLLIAADAAENSLRRAAHFADLGGCPLLRLSASKGELGGSVGRTACAMLAVTDIGFAAAIAEKLAEADPERYGEAADALRVKADRAAERRKEQLRHEKNLRTGKVRRTPQKPAEKPESAPRRKEREPDAKRRYAAARPVKKGKGSPKKKP